MPMNLTRSLSNIRSFVRLRSTLFPSPLTRFLSSFFPSPLVHAVLLSFGPTHAVMRKCGWLHLLCSFVLRFRRSMMALRQSGIALPFNCLRTSIAMHQALAPKRSSLIRWVVWSTRRFASFESQSVASHGARLTTELGRVVTLCQSHFLLQRVVKGRWSSL